MKTIQECLKLVVYVNEVYSKIQTFLIKGLVLERWNKQYNISNRTLKNILKDKSLTVHDKHSLLNALGTVECIKAKLNRHSKIGYGINSNSLSQCH